MAMSLRLGAVMKPAPSVSIRAASPLLGWFELCGTIRLGFPVASLKKSVRCRGPQTSHRWGMMTGSVASGKQKMVYTGLQPRTEESRLGRKVLNAGQEGSEKVYLDLTPKVTSV